MARTLCNFSRVGLCALAIVLLAVAILLAPTGRTYGDDGGGGGVPACAKLTCQNTCIQTSWPGCPAAGQGCNQTVFNCSRCTCTTVNFGTDNPPTSGSCECTTSA